MLWPGAIYWINELLTNTWVWLIEMPIWILFCVMKLEHWQVQPVGLSLSSSHGDNLHQQRLQDRVEYTPMEKVSGTSLFSDLEDLQPCSSCEWIHGVPSYHVLCFFLLQLLLFCVLTVIYYHHLQWQVKSGRISLESWCEIGSHFPDLVVLVEFL